MDDLSVGLSSALWQNSGSDPDAVWQHSSDGSRDEVGSGVWGSVHGKVYLWGEFGARHCNQWRLYGVRVRQRHSAATRPCSQITLGKLDTTTTTAAAAIAYIWYNSLTTPLQRYMDVGRTMWSTPCGRDIWTDRNKISAGQFMTNKPVAVSYTHLTLPTNREV